MKSGILCRMSHGEEGTTIKINAWKTRGCAGQWHNESDLVLWGGCMQV